MIDVAVEDEEMDEDASRDRFKSESGGLKSLRTMGTKRDIPDSLGEWHRSYDDKIVQNM